jgi:hypothetical protein
MDDTATSDLSQNVDEEDNEHEEPDLDIPSIGLEQEKKRTHLDKASSDKAYLDKVNVDVEQKNPEYQHVKGKLQQSSASEYSNSQKSLSEVTENTNRSKLKRRLPKLLSSDDGVKEETQDISTNNNRIKENDDSTLTEDRLSYIKLNYTGLNEDFESKTLQESIAKMRKIKEMREKRIEDDTHISQPLFDGLGLSPRPRVFGESEPSRIRHKGIHGMDPQHYTIDKPPMMPESSKILKEYGAIDMQRQDSRNSKGSPSFVRPPSIRTENLGGYDYPVFTPLARRPSVDVSCETYGEYSEEFKLRAIKNHIKDKRENDFVHNLQCFEANEKVYATILKWCVEERFVSGVSKLLELYNFKAIYLAALSLISYENVEIQRKLMDRVVQDSNKNMLLIQMYDMVGQGRRSGSGRNLIIIQQYLKKENIARPSHKLYLEQAIKDNDIRRIGYWSSYDDTDTDYLIKKAFYQFCESGNVSNVHYLLTKFEPSRQLDLVKSDNCHSIEIACQNGYVELVRYFFAYNLENRDIVSAFKTAHAYGHVEILEALIHEKRPRFSDADIDEILGRKPVANEKIVLLYIIQLPQFSSAESGYDVEDALDAIRQPSLDSMRETRERSKSDNI